MHPHSKKVSHSYSQPKFVKPCQAKEYVGNVVKKNLVLSQDEPYYVHNLNNALVGDTIKFIITHPAEANKNPVIQVTSVVKRGRMYYLATVVSSNTKIAVKIFGNDYEFPLPSDLQRFSKGSRHLDTFSNVDHLEWVKSLDIYSNDEIIRYCFQCEDNLCDEPIVESQTEETLDQKDLYTITVDPIQSKDFDDAISIDPKNNKIMIHIADVSAFVKPGSKLDIRLYLAQFSTYCNNKTYHMCPESLATDKCSLLPGVERSAATVELSYDPDTLMILYKKTKHYKSKIISKRRFHYEEVDDILQSYSTTNEYEALLLLKRIFMTNAFVKRFSEHQPKISKVIDGQIIFEKQTKDDSHAIIEFYMLFANQYVAFTLRKQNKSFPKRVHPPPKHPEKIEEIRNMTLPPHCPEEFRAFLLLRCLPSAYYSAIDNGHYALGMDDYTHFTSPIRRYVDIINHRCLFDKTVQYSQKDMEAICKKANEMEQRSRAIDEMKSYLQNIDIAREWKQANKKLQCIICSMFVAGFNVFVIELGITLPIFISDISSVWGEFFKLDTTTQEWKAKTKVIRLYELVTCRIKAAVDKIELEIL